MAEETVAELETGLEVAEPENTEQAPVGTDVPEEAVENVESAPTEEPVEPEKSGFQKRIDELYRLRKEAEERATAAEQREAQLRQQQFRTSYESTKPTLEDYNYDQDAWAKGMEQWMAVGQQRAWEQHQQAEQQKQMQAAEAHKQAMIYEKAHKAMEKYPDFMAKIQDPSLPSLQQLSPDAFEAVVESDNMGEVAYYLANNPSEVYKFQGMSRVQAIREVVKLEAKLTMKPASPPPPPASIEGRSTATIDPDKMDMKQWMEWRQKQLAQR